MWREVLHVEDIGIDDDFFELGGHSLLATQVMSRLRDRFQLELPLSRLFEFPTIDDLARYIETTRWGAEGRKTAPETAGTELEKGEL